MSSEVYTILRDFVLTATPTMLIAGVIFIVCILIWIILRPLNYWYWKVDQRDRMLEDMDKKISEIRYLQLKSRETARRKNHSVAAQCVQAEEPPETIKNERQRDAAGGEQIEAAGLMPAAGETAAGSINEPAPVEARSQACFEQEKAATRPGKFSTTEDAIAKNGVAYTREQIEQKIRF